MKKLLLNATVLCLLLAISGVSTLAQRTGKSLSKSSSVSAAIQKSPFDFTDKFYAESGIESSFIINRKNGNDKMSVFDMPTDQKFGNVRILATEPAYDQNGDLVFFNRLGDFWGDGFMNAPAGEAVKEAAENMAMYVFPSTTRPGADRQAPIIDNRSKYAIANPIGVRVVVEVQFNLNPKNSDDVDFYNELVEKHGATLDGTPIIRSTDNLMVLLHRGMITFNKRGLWDESVPSYAITPVIMNPVGGAIAPDAFLMTVLYDNGKPLPLEESFIDTFKCLQLTGNYCFSN